MPFAGFSLRPYQHEAHDAAVGFMDGGDDPIISLATGAGKTVIFTAVGTTRNAQTDGRTLYVCHRSELADQIESWVNRVDPKHPPAREQADMRADAGMYRSKHVVALVQSISRKHRLEVFKPSEFTTVVFDESHRSRATSYQSLFEHFGQNPRCRFLGVSATWMDAKGKPIGSQCGYSAVAYRATAVDMIRQGWLVPLRTAAITVKGIDWSNVSPDTTLFSESELDEVMSEEGVLHELFLAIRDKCHDRPTLMFCAGGKQVRAMSAVANRYNRGSSRWITDDARLTEQGRKSFFSDFRAGLYQYLVNHAIVTEGTDLPTASCAAICRPVQSEPLLAQMVGRTMRPLDGVLPPDTWHDADVRLKAIAESPKPDSIVLDFCGVSGRKILTSADILGGDRTPEVRERARKMIEAGEEGDVLEILDRADAEWALIQEEIERRRNIVAGGVQYACEEVDLFDARSQPVIPKRTNYSSNQKAPATDKQVNFILSLSNQLAQLGKGRPWRAEKAKSLSKLAAMMVITRLQGQLAG